MRAAAAAVLALASALAGACGGPRPLDETAAPPAPATAAVYTRYAAADDIIVGYCAGCHARDGKHPDQPRAHQVLALDSYADWHQATTVIAAVLDTRHLDGSVMPPADAPAQPTDAERSLLLDWTRRGAPDTSQGQ